MEYTAVLYHYWGICLKERQVPGDVPRQGDILFLKSPPNSHGPGSRYKVTVIERIFQETEDKHFKESGLKVHMQMIKDDETFNDMCRVDRQKDKPKS
ncbi:hypothetical protein FJZ19_00065 [Candidatus Pacearchaeota archaeon]|nr:hypothetical protein [Candidatus Pacearchaeota archaeon]